MLSSLTPLPVLEVSFNGSSGFTAASNASKLPCSPNSRFASFPVLIVGSSAFISGAGVNLFDLTTFSSCPCTTLPGVKALGQQAFAKSGLYFRLHHCEATSLDESKGSFREATVADRPL
jgi:hypothetical protein